MTRSLPEIAEHGHPVAAQDAQVWDLISAEQRRQQSTLDLIASENHVSPAVMAAMGSCMTNKYCEGYPANRWYCGCAWYDEVERLTIDRATQIFGCRFANVQPHSGSNANLAVCFALLEPGDTFMSMVLSDGAHLTHGSPVNLSGKWLKPVHYPLVYDESRDDYGYIDYDAVLRLARTHRPKLIMCGYSAYPRTIDFARFGRIADEVGAVLMADIAHIAGLVAGGVHPSPFPHSGVVTTTTHKTLRGPRGGMVLSNDAQIAEKIDRAVFPGTQGGPLMHVIAAKAVCFGEALQPSFEAYAAQIVANAAVLAEALMDRGYRLWANGTDNHLILIDLSKTHPDLTGRQASTWLESAGIVVNKNTVPKDKRSAYLTSGVRLGTAALTTRGFEQASMRRIVEWIDRVLVAGGDEGTCRSVRCEVTEFCLQYPLPH